MKSQQIKLLFIFLFLFISLSITAQEYKKWEQHDVKGFYEKHEINIAKNEYANIEYDAVDKDGNSIYSTRIEYKDTDYGEFIYFTKTKISSGLYEIEVYEKVNSKLWQVKGKNIYLLFRYNPYLYKYDEGVLDVSYRDGIFYKKP
jgi:hypothetical protein